MIDAGFDNPKVEFPIDPFWREHSKKILNFKKAISYPSTKIGEQAVVSQHNIPVFRTYNRLPEIFSSIVSMIEYDEIFNKQGDYFFKDSVNQRALVKAFALVVEDAVKSRQIPEQDKNYKDYLPFFNALTKKLKMYDSVIEQVGTYPNIVNSLIGAFSQSVNMIPGVENFQIIAVTIRDAIRIYLPEYKTLDGGRQLQAQIKTIKQL